jgi:hypothetical protein
MLPSTGEEGVAEACSSRAFRPNSVRSAGSITHVDVAISATVPVPHVMPDAEPVSARVVRMRGKAMSRGKPYTFSMDGWCFVKALCS